MSSKIFSLSSLLLLNFFILSLVGCDFKIGEKPPPPESQEFGGTRCLSDMNPVVKAFIDGNAKNEDVITAWNCATSAVEKFKRYVRGRTADRYTSQELATFLENNFLDVTPTGRRISPELQVEFMKLKQVFVGGSADYLTRTEIDKLIVLFGELRTMTVSLNPFMKVFSMNWTVSEARGLQMDIRYFEDANREIQSAAKTLASLIETNSPSYKFSDFISLLNNLDAFFGEHWDFPRTIAKYMPIVKKVKKALAGGDENSITPSEWRRFTLLGARGYVQFLRYHYFIKSAPETGSGYRLSYLSRTLEDGLSVFQDLVAEKPEGVVSRAEVVELLKTLQVVWPEFKVSPNLVFELMKVKQLFFGGTVESFTTTDFGTARLKVSRIKTLVERFLPYYLIYGGEWDPEIYSPEDAQLLFHESQAVLESTVREAGQLFEGSYDLNDLIALAHEAEVLYPPVPGQSWEAQARKLLPLIVDVKNMILGGSDSTLRQSHWSLLLGFSARFYTDFLYHNYFVKGHDLEVPGTVSSISVLVNQSLDIFRDILLVKQPSQFSRDEINTIAQHLIRIEVLPRNLKAKSVDGFVGVVLNNVLVDPDRRIDGYTPEALTLSSVEVLRREAQIWLDTELYFARMTEGWRADQGLTPTELLESLEKAQKDSSITSSLREGIKELLLSVQSPVHEVIDEAGRVIISRGAAPNYNSKSLRRLNINRTLARVMVRSFVTSKDRIANYSGANLQEVEGAFAILRPLLVELDLLNPKNLSFASSRFREANIFMPHSDGNTLASHAEVTDLIGLIWSGVTVNSILRKELIRVCFNGVEQKESALVDIKCARTAYRAAMPSAMAATPDYVRFMGNAPKAEWSYYMNNIFKAAGYIPNEKGMAVLEDISLAPHVIQYVEMIYSRFDKNNDGYISSSESLKAFPSFKEMLLELAKEQIANGSIEERDLLDLFTYILRYGKPPETTYEKLRFVLAWKGKPNKWDVWADRVMMSQILGYIADQITKSEKKPVNLKSSESQSWRLSQ